jgi:hypothetical protein
MYGSLYASCFSHTSTICEKTMSASVKLLIGHTICFAFEECK